MLRAIGFLYTLLLADLLHPLFTIISTVPRYCHSDSARPDNEIIKICRRIAISNAKNKIMMRRFQTSNSKMLSPLYYISTAENGALNDYLFNKTKPITIRLGGKGWGGWTATDELGGGGQTE